MAFSVELEDSATTGSGSSVQTLASDSFTPQAGSKLFVWAVCQVDSGHEGLFDWAVTNTGGLTFTILDEPPPQPWAGNNGFSLGAMLAVADVGSAPGSMTVTVDAFTGSEPNKTGSYSMVVWSVVADGELSIVQADANVVEKSAGNSESLATPTITAVTSGNLTVVGFGTGNDGVGAFATPTGTGITALDVSQTSNWTKAAVWTSTTFTGTSSTCSDLGEQVGTGASFIMELAETGGAEEHEAAASLGLTVGITATAVKAAAGNAALSLQLSAGPTGEKAGQAAGTVDVDVAVDATATMLAVAAATFGVTVGADAAGAKGGEGSSTLELEVGADATAAKTTQVSAALALAVEISASAVKAAEVAASLGIDLGLAATAEGSAEGHVSAEMALALAVAATAAKTAKATTTVPVVIDVDATAEKAATPTATLGIDLGISATAAKSASVVATLPLVLSLATLARTLGLTAPAATSTGAVHAPTSTGGATAPASVGTATQPRSVRT